MHNLFTQMREEPSDSQWTVRNRVESLAIIVSVYPSLEICSSRYLSIWLYTEATKSNLLSALSQMIVNRDIGLSDAFVSLDFSKACYLTSVALIHNPSFERTE
eukprot:GHVN01085596.1.p2 GENE.GHVN01085596.1~~GHVN01085596.1.p2  ORF type:complete len:103 (-),score=7.25 GHVN01085596.1:593-901(-)